MKLRLTIDSISDITPEVAARLKTYPRASLEGTFRYHIDAHLSKHPLLERCESRIRVKAELVEEGEV